MGLEPPALGLGIPGLGIWGTGLWALKHGNALEFECGTLWDLMLDMNAGMLWELDARMLWYVGYRALGLGISGFRT